MATFYVFDLDVGAQMHANEASTIECPDGTKTPAQVQVGDRVAHVAGAWATVTNITTQEV